MHPGKTNCTLYPLISLHFTPKFAFDRTMNGYFRGFDVRSKGNHRIICVCVCVIVNNNAKWIYYENAKQRKLSLVLERSLTFQPKEKRLKRKIVLLSWDSKWIRFYKLLEPGKTILLLKATFYVIWFIIKEYKWLISIPNRIISFTNIQNLGKWLPH